MHLTAEHIHKQLKDDHNWIPVTQSFEMDHQLWFQLYKQLSQGKSYHALLESGRAGQYSIIAVSPTHVIRGKDDQLDILALKKDGTADRIKCLQGDLTDDLKRWMGERKAFTCEGLPDYKGGLLGFFSYDLVRQFEQLPEQSRDDLRTPDVYVMAFEEIILFDHHKEKHLLVRYEKLEERTLTGIQESLDRGKRHLLARQEEIKQILSKLKQKNMENRVASEEMITHASQSLSMHDGRQNIKPSFTEKGFVQAVKKIQEYISAGDVFQVNLSVRQTRPLEVRPLDVYEALRHINPSPYMGYLHFPDLQIVSGSPEQLIKLQGKKVNTRPIAGTRPRGTNREEDLQLAQELIENEKERAEHVMLVDLERNDLGKVSRYGSVEVNEFMVIEEYSHVMHIVSNVRGELEEGKDAFDVIRAVFPGGTITGAPKVRTMEIIEELEPVRRGLYTGSIGWIDYSGDMELNIVIRTMLAKDGKIYVQAGAGVVIDSIPENEYKESLKKAEALWKAYETALNQHRQKKKIEELSV